MATIEASRLSEALTVRMDEETLIPSLDFCCGGAKRAWHAEVMVIVPEVRGENDPFVFTVALNYEGGASLQIRYCPFCGTRVQPSDPIAP